MRTTVTFDIHGTEACFTRPEHRVERVSYKIPTPSAAVGIATAIYSKPEVEMSASWVAMLRIPRWISRTTNERRTCDGKEHTQRHSLMLADVGYRICVNLDAENPTKHWSIFQRRLRNGQCYHSIKLGRCVEAVTNFSLPEKDIHPVELNEDLGLMFWGVDKGSPDMESLFFHAKLEHGVMKCPSRESLQATLASS